METIFWDLAIFTLPLGECSKWNSNLGRTLMQISLTRYSIAIRKFKIGQIISSKYLFSCNNLFAWSFFLIKKSLKSKCYISFKSWYNIRGLRFFHFQLFLLAKLSTQVYKSVNEKKILAWNNLALIKSHEILFFYKAIIEMKH